MACAWRRWEQDGSDDAPGYALRTALRQCGNHLGHALASVRWGMMREGSRLLPFGVFHFHRLRPSHLSIAVVRFIGAFLVLSSRHTPNVSVGFKDSFWWGTQNCYSNSILHTLFSSYSVGQVLLKSYKQSSSDTDVLQNTQLLIKMNFFLVCGYTQKVHFNLHLKKLNAKWFLHVLHA